MFSEDEDDDVMKKVMEEVRDHLNISQKAVAHVAVRPSVLVTVKR